MTCFLSCSTLVFLTKCNEISIEFLNYFGGQLLDFSLTFKTYYDPITNEYTGVNILISDYICIYLTTRDWKDLISLHAYIKNSIVNIFGVELIKAS